MTAPLPELIRQYLTSRATRKDSVHTHRRLVTELDIITGLIAEQAETEPDQLTADDLGLHPLRAAFATYAATRSRSTIAGCWSTWNGFLGFLVAEHIIDGNPMQGIDRPRPPAPTPRALQGGTDTVERLLASVAAGERPARRPWPERDLAVIACYVTTGLRQQELAALTVADLDAADDGARLRVTGKGGKQRWAPVSPALASVIAVFQASRVARFKPRAGKIPSGEPLLCNDAGGQLTPANLRWLVKACYRAAGVSSKVPAGAMVHALRHTCATLLAEQGATATDIQAVLGHGNLATSQRYISVTDGRVRAASESSPAVAALQRHRPRHDLDTPQVQAPAADI